MRTAKSQFLGGIAKLFVLSSALALGAATAHAQVNISGSVANLRYTVADPDPTDGVASTARVGGWLDLAAANGEIYGWHIGGIWRTGEITFGVGATAYITSPVPEPQAWQLLAAGLVLVPAWARRRRAARAPRA